MQLDGLQSQYFRLHLFNLIRLGRFKLLVLKTILYLLDYFSFIYYYLFLFQKTILKGLLLFIKLLLLLLSILLANILKKGNSFITLCVIFSISVLIESFVILIQFFSSYEWIVGEPQIQTCKLH